MIRRVAFGKAILAGAAGALAWEILARVLILLDLPLFDLVFTLGTMVLGEVGPWLWWPVGMAMHSAVGAIWAIFYAYFFWSTYDWPPIVQGLVFSLGPAALAGLIMVPQLSVMHPSMVRGSLPATGLFAAKRGVGWSCRNSHWTSHLWRRNGQSVRQARRLSSPAEDCSEWVSSCSQPHRV